MDPNPQIRAACPGAIPSLALELSPRLRSSYPPLALELSPRLRSGLVERARLGTASPFLVCCKLVVVWRTVLLSDSSLAHVSPSPYPLPRGVGRVRGP